MMAVTLLTVVIPISFRAPSFFVRIPPPVIRVPTLLAALAEVRDAHVPPLHSDSPDVRWPHVAYDLRVRPVAGNRRP